MRAFFDHTIANNRRTDGLYHAYNLIRFEDDGIGIEHLHEMLEGQVAVLSSGYLGPKDSLALLQNLRDSAIYRPDQNSYMLYPDREQVHFLDRNVIPESLLGANAWIGRELSAQQVGIIERDAEGGVHFHGDLRNANDLAAALRRRPDISAGDATAIGDVYEAVFRHRRFTGRSGSMFKYEGLGCIYWHMVSKLLLATAEVIDGAMASGADEHTLNGLCVLAHARVQRRPATRHDRASEGGHHRAIHRTRRTRRGRACCILAQHAQARGVSRRSGLPGQPGLHQGIDKTAVAHPATICIQSGDHPVALLSPCAACR